MQFSHTYRPKTLEDIVGQQHLFSKNSVLFHLIRQNKLEHSFFYGSPGTGKTTTAKVISHELRRDFYLFDGANFKLSELRKIIEKHQNSLFEKPIIFIDEVHRLSKTQQEALLLPMENNQILLIGASTENPYYTLTNAMRSRSLLFEFKALKMDDLLQLLDRVIQKENLSIDSSTKNKILQLSHGDARAMLNLVEVASSLSTNITEELINNIKSIKTKDTGTNTKYQLVSAMIKSLRGSDIDASIYYLARLIDMKETPDYIARRLVIFSSEDIGNANPNALNLATNTLLSVKEIGYPEARIMLSQCVVYLASSPKSNASYLAINKALAYIENSDKLPQVPEHLKPGNKNYQYPHDGPTTQNYMEWKLPFYESKNIGYEKTLNDWNQSIKGKAKH